MKKIFVLLMCTVILTFVSCEDEPLEGNFVTGGLTCETAVVNTAQAALNFLSVNDDNYTQSCVAYRNALEAQILACGDPDNSLQNAVDTLGDCTVDNQQASDIEGTWLLTGWIGTEAIDLNADGTESFNFLDEMDCYNNETLVFNADATAVAMSTSYAEIGVEVIVGTENDLAYTIDCIDEIENTNATWTQSGNTISVTSGGATSDWTLNGNQLSILIPEGFGASNEDGSVTTSQDLTFVYTKQ